ncbi:lysophospholipid acyltransferase family protein [Gordonia sp. PKS22-38]|uniref:Lysophospholipid acyltransferase family protein n=1 Tax=Gordonia prachuapensis TaxID=3115651 RepID=A0ABU7MXW0_9ACTN|nr:lysophospholipid acyltransferase family protein [Gordonia sp. PKS22-38]
MGPVDRWFARPVVSGALPEGPVVLAPNHLAEIDSLVLCAALPRRLTFVAKSEYFARDGAGARFYGTLCRLTGQIPIQRDGVGSADVALATASGILQRGRVWAIYPEGTRSPDGRLWRGRTGVMRVALQGNHPVVPVGIVGTRSINPRGTRGWRRGRVEIRIGEPLRLAKWSESSTDPASWREATNELMAAIQKLTGQEYVDRHSSARERARRDAA